MLFEILVMLFICELVSLVQNLKPFIEEFLKIHLEKLMEKTDADKKRTLAVARLKTRKHLPRLSVCFQARLMF